LEDAAAEGKSTMNKAWREDGKSMRAVCVGFVRVGVLLMLAAWCVQMRSAVGQDAAMGAGPTSAAQRSDVPPRSAADITTRGPFAFSCTPKAGGGASPLKVSYYNTEPALALIEFRKGTRPAFQALSGSGAKYESNDAMFWEHQGEAMLRWSGIDYTCKRSAGKQPD